MMKLGLWRLSCLPLTALATAAGAQAPASVAEVVRQIAANPELAHGRLGVEFYSLDKGQALYSRDGDKFFTPGSTTKLVTEGAALALLGPDYRFHTRVYRTGPIKAGVLNGNIVIVASGDPNLSGRVGPDGKLGFVDEDHDYGGMPLPGDPVMPITKLAQRIAAMGVRRITGTVLIDVSLFAEGDHEGGSGMAISPIVVNDNTIDVLITPGSGNQPPTVRSAPEVSHVRFVNKLSTGAAGTDPAVDQVAVTLPDGTREVTLRGSVPSGHAVINSPYAVDSPSSFAADVLITQLRKAGVTVGPAAPGGHADSGAFKASYRPDMLVSDIVSPPLSEDVRITLKVSQNLHAATMPYLIGSLLGKATINADRRGLAMIHDWLEKAQLDLSGAVQADGAGASADFTPDFMVHYLAYMAKQPFFPAFQAGLPVLGKDGTLADVSRDSKAAGHVFAKTGTFISADFLNDGIFVDGKGLAGYTTSPSGERLAFALYLNKVPVRARADDGGSAMNRMARVVADPLGAIAAAANLGPLTQSGEAGSRQ
jgi:D-alanyl-D-alanine carboxypeptidase/D-alanyl-D-alanine-endopeptidase (penicillin-binding protein 4)